MQVNTEGKPITDWMQVFSKLYSTPDAGRTPEQIWVAVMAHASAMGECVRRYAFRELLGKAAHEFCWLCSFVNRCNELSDDIFSLSASLSGIVSLKYPLVCGRCESKPCGCHSAEEDEKPDKSARYERLLQTRKDILASVEAYCIEQWKRNLSRGVFASQVHISSIETIAFHFLEEVGEGATAVRKLGQLRAVADAGVEGVDRGFLRQLTTVSGIVENFSTYKVEDIEYDSMEPSMIKWRIVEAKLGLVAELGDMFSWFCSLLHKLDYLTSQSSFDALSLEKTLANEYYNEEGNIWCPTCKENPCECVFFP